jgi:glycosyltransferase involved in cell wall biosynthesis
VLILVENAAIPYDRRVMAEANSLLANGYTVSIICPTASQQPARESLGGVLVRRYRSRPSRGGAASQVAEYLVALVKTFWLMLSLARDPGFDVIHACNPPDLFFLVAWPFRLFGVRFLFDQHDLSPELYAALYGRDSGVVMRALKWSERRSYKAADAVVTVNESYKRLAVSRGGVAPERVFVVRNGPREGWPRAVEPRPELSRGREHLVVYMGVMGYQDGVDVLLDAVAALTGPMGMGDVTFALVGDGNAAASLKERAAALGIEEYVDFVGWVSDEDTLSAYLVTADACVCPEPSSPLNDHSTFIKVMEYMASGTPVVAFDLPETRVSAGEAALYATPGDVEGFAALLRDVLTDEELAARMRARAAERIGSLRWERQVPALLAAYECALGEKRRG